MTVIDIHSFIHSFVHTFINFFNVEKTIVASTNLHEQKRKMILVIMMMIKKVN